MKRRYKKHSSPHFRNHTETEKSYIFFYKKFIRVCELATAISLQQGGIETDGRGRRAADIFTRQVLTAHSLEKLLPVLRNGSDPEIVVWDLPTISLVSRSVMENFQALYFYGTEAISEAEADFRFQIFQKDRNAKWRDIRKKAGQSDNDLSEFISGVPEQQARILNHNFFKQLTKEQQVSIKKGKEFYYSKAEFEEFCPRLFNIGFHYKLMSNLAHPLPLAIERIDEICGHGSPSDADIRLVIVTLNVATDCLIASIEEMADKFADHIGARFRSRIQELAEYPTCE